MVRVFAFFKRSRGRDEHTDSDVSRSIDRFDLIDWIDRKTSKYMDRKTEYRHKTIIQLDNTTEIDETTDQTQI